MLDGFGEGQWHVNINSVDGTAVRINIVVVFIDILSADDPPDHRLALLIANDLRVVVWCVCSAVILAVGSGQVGLRCGGSSRLRPRCSGCGGDERVVPRLHNRVLAGLDVGVGS